MRQLPALYLNLLVCSALGLFAIAMGMDFVEGMENGIMVGVADVFSTFPTARYTSRKASKSPWRWPVARSSCSFF